MCEITGIPGLDAQLLADMRGWIADCQWGDLESDDVADLSDAQVLAGVREHYSGGVAQFLADGEA